MPQSLSKKGAPVLHTALSTPAKNHLSTGPQSIALYPNAPVYYQKGGNSTVWTENILRRIEQTHYPPKQRSKLIKTPLNGQRQHFYTLILRKLAPSSRNLRYSKSKPPFKNAFVSTHSYVVRPNQ